jgi:hypothetical protein
MATTQQLFYAVAAGGNPGIYTDQDMFLDTIKHYPRPKYETFHKLELAAKVLRVVYRMQDITVYTKNGAFTLEEFMNASPPDRVSPTPEEPDVEQLLHAVIESECSQRERAEAKIEELEQELRVVHRQVNIL